MAVSSTGSRADASQILLSPTSPTTAYNTFLPSVTLPTS